MALRRCPGGRAARCAPSRRRPPPPRPGRRGPPRSSARSRGRGRCRRGCACQIAAGEALEGALGEVRRRSPRPDRRPRAPGRRAATGTQRDLARAVAQRVVDEVAERLAQAQLVGIHGPRVAGVDRDRAAALAGAVGEAPLRRARAARAARAARGRTGSSPSLVRATISRSSASCARWSHSSTDAISASRTCGSCPPARSAPSSSALMTATGVRSSWLASATKRRSRSNERPRRSSISLSVSPSRRISSCAAGSGSRSSARLSETSLRAPAHRLDRAQPGGGQRVAEQGRDEDGDGTAEGERRHEVAQRLVAVVERLADRDDLRVAAGLRQHARRPLDAGHAALHEDLLAGRGSPQFGRLSAGARDAAGAVEHAAVGAQQLREALLGSPAAPADAAFAARTAVARAASPAVTLSLRSLLQPQVDEQAGAREHDRHRDRERGGQPQPDRQPAHVPPSRRSR